jgi:hypothetical protein
MAIDMATSSPQFLEMPTGDLDVVANQPTAVFEAVNDRLELPG